MDDIKNQYFKQVIKETKRLENLFKNGQIDDDKIDVGLELEYHLLDQNMDPYFANLEVIQSIEKKLNQTILIPEAISSVVEANSDHFTVDKDVLSNLHEHLFTYWQECSQAVQQFNCILCGIGTLPTYLHQHLDYNYITKAYRYINLVKNINHNRYNLNRLMGLQGKNYIEFKSKGIGFMGATSAQQIHLRVPFKSHVDYYNASLIASGILIALSSNSLYFLSKELWHESRIFIFEHINFLIRRAHCPRVSLGENYLEGSFLNLFHENNKHLPLVYDLKLDSEDPLWHLKHHNSTVWRWNKPVIGENKDNSIHLRVENRVLASAPSIIDTVAYTAFYIGLVHEIVTSHSDYRDKLKFDKVLSNFYLAAQNGIHTNLDWFNDVNSSAKNIIVKHALPMAKAGLAKLQVDPADCEYFLGVIYSRVVKNFNPSDWQKKTLKNLNNNLNELTFAYHSNQLKNIPVSDWNYKL